MSKWYLNFVSVWLNNYPCHDKWLNLHLPVSGNVYTLNNHFYNVKNWRMDLHHVQLVCMINKCVFGRFNTSLCTLVCEREKNEEKRQMSKCKRKWYNMDHNWW